MPHGYIYEFLPEMNVTTVDVDFWQDRPGVISTSFEDSTMCVFCTCSDEDMGPSKASISANGAERGTLPWYLDVAVPYWRFMSM